MKRIVLTGGPGAGKTVISRRIVADNPAAYMLVPEAATQIYDALQTRWDRLDLEGRKRVQREIYRFQLDQEAQIALQHPEKCLILDRGTIDVAAYCPDGAEAYWQDLGSTYQHEIARYDRVICLQTCAVVVLYDGDRSNPRRFEDSSGAIENDHLLMRLWDRHPNFLRIDACINLEEKIRRVKMAIETRP